MSFAQPQLLWWSLPLLAALGVFLVWSWRRRQQLVRQFVQARLLDTLTAGVSRGRQKARLWLVFLGVALVALSLARPQWGMAWEETKQRGLDIVVAIDTSRSMLATDIAPNRLARARLASLDLMREARSDRLGLVAFAGTAFLQCPLTLDEEAFRQSVNALDTTIIPQGGSALAEAIRTAQTAFGKDEDNYRVLILFTDGEDHEEGAVEAAREAAGAGLRIFTVGVGSAEGELLRVTDEQGQPAFLKDAEGNAVKSRLNEGLLREIATVANGFYLPLRGANVIETLYERGLAPLPKAEISTKFIRRFHERFQWPLALGLILLTIELFVNDRRRQPVVAGARAAGKPANAAAVGLLLLFASGWEAAASPSTARRLFEAGRYREARTEYERLLDEKPDDVRLRYNAGAAAYRSEDYAGALAHFEAALRAEDVQLQQQAYYNLGNTLYRAGEPVEDPQEKIAAWEKSVQSYESALKLHPQDADAQHNLELVRKRLEELKQQQPQQQQQNQQQQDKEQKDDPNQQQPQQDQSQKPQENQPEQKPQPKPEQQSEQKDQKDSQSDTQNQDQKAGDQRNDPKQQGEQQDQKSKQSQGQKPDQPEESGEQATGAVGQMTVQQALQLLDTQKDEVRALIFRPAEPGKARSRTWKDW
jgi:Ca-activated chloride channel homolog